MRARMSWDALRVLVVVQRAGSLSAAADELGLAQSSVSEQVARLERSLGFALLERSPSGVRPTARGADLLARISGPVDALAAALGDGDADGDEIRTVFLGGPAEFLSEVVLPRIRRSLPATVHLATRFGLADDLLDDLRSGSIDVLVSALAVRGSDLVSEPIYDEEFVLVAHRQWADGEPPLDTIPVLAYGPELPIVRRYWRSVFGRRPDQLVATVVASDLRALLRLALDGAGMTALPRYLADPHLEAGTLVELHRPDVPPLNTLYAVALKPKANPDPVVGQVWRAVVDAARDAR